MKKPSILFNRSAGHPVVNLQEDQNVVLTTNPNGDFKSIEISNEDVTGFDCSNSYFTDTIVDDSGNTKTFLGKLTKKGKSKLLNFLKG
jgi:hypothetical protein